MAIETTILHADADAFFASVEQRDYARLRGRPIAVGLVGVAISNLDSGSGDVQLALPVDGIGGIELDAALDEIHERFGSGAVRRPARQMGVIRPTLTSG